MTGEFKGKVAVVTGGGSGIGRALCQAFSANGVHVIAADIDLEAAQETVAALGENAPAASAANVDVGSADSWETLREDVLSAHGRCDILCNNAGVMKVGAFLDAPLADWEIQARVNTVGVVLGCMAFLPDMIERRSGVVVNTASLAGLHPWPDAALYAASKYAVVGMSETLRGELEGTGVHLALLCPGGIDTPMTASLGNDPEEERLVAPEEVAQRVLQGIRDRRQWIFTHEEYLPALEARHSGIAEDHAPLLANASA